MSTDRVAVIRESVPTCWTERDERFFMLVADVLSTGFLRGAGALLASYDPDDAPLVDGPAPQHRPSASVPRQRSLDGWTVDPNGRLRYGTA